MANIIMIEDDEEFAELLINYLERYNFKVTNYSDPYLGVKRTLKPGS